MENLQDHSQKVLAFMIHNGLQDSPIEKVVEEYHQANENCLDQLESYLLELVDNGQEAKVIELFNAYL